MSTMVTDVRLAVRVLRRDPLFAALAVFMLASGLTGAVLVFSLANAVLLRPLPYAGAPELVVVTDRYQRAAFPAFSPTVPEILDLRAGARAFSEIAFIDHRDVQVRGRAEPERVYVGRASLNFFTLLGVQPLLGRTFDERDAGAGETQAVVLSHALWRRLYHADPQVVGQAITVNGNAGTIIGVLPPTFAFDHATLGIPEAVDIYTPFPNDSDYTTRAGSYANVRRVIALARLKPGVTIDRARIDCERIARQLVNDYRRLYVGPKGEDYGFSMALTPLNEAIVGSSRSSLLLLLAAVGLMLAIACANTAGLLLTRAIARRPELAVRAALGASRWRLVRQFLAESLVLAAASGALSLLFTAWLLPVAIRLGATRLPRIEEASIDGRVVLFAAALSFATAMLFGLIPAMQSRTDALIVSLTMARKGTLAAASRSRLRPALVIGQIALSVMLLVGAGLLTRSLTSLRQLPLGFSPDRILTLRLSLPYYAYSGRTAPSAVYEEMRRRVLAVPGVESAAMSTAIPVREGQTASIAIAGKPNDMPDRARRLAVTQLVSPDYFETLRIPTLSGRVFTEGDDDKAPGVVVINETMARQFWPGEQAVGQQLLFFGPKPVTIIGIVGDTRAAGLARTPRPQLYRALLQSFEPNMALLVRTTGDPGAMTRSVQQAVWAQDPGQALFRIETMEGVLAQTMAEPRQRMLVAMLVAGLALVMALTGLFGIVSYRVAQRTPEIGIRMALGAQGRDVLRLLLRQTATLVLFGIALGIAGSLTASRVIARLLYGASALDAFTYAAVALLFALTALLASYLPARRATRINPVVALRAE